jgi:EAL domain-containing protein (putative c-di-GMP-specific phosphodiesterase class I)
MTTALSSQLARELRVALLTQQLHLTIQQKFSLKNGQEVGGEVLLRWEHPRYGLIKADQWVKLAEIHGLMTPLSHYLIQKVVKLLSKERQRLPLAINISPSSLDMNLAHFIVAAIKKEKVDPKQLEIELTESTLPKTYAILIKSIDYLTSHGMKTALDDFGVGYNCMRYLVDLGVNAIKIDKSFVQQAPQATTPRLILKSMIDLAKEIDLEVVCEGIETPEQLFLAKTLGADIGQGFLFGKPEAVYQDNDFARPLTFHIQKLAS